MVIFGIVEEIGDVKIPWWVSPSLPTSPARSIANTTGGF